MEANDLATEHKPKPHASGLSGSERLEQTLGYVGRNARSVILDVDPDLITEAP